MRFEELSTLCHPARHRLVNCTFRRQQQLCVQEHHQHPCAVLQQESRAGPGKQLRNQHSPEISCFALKKREQNHQQNTGVTQNELPLFSPT